MAKRLPFHSSALSSQSAKSMPDRIPTSEMIPDEGSCVLCWGWLIDDTVFEAWIGFYESGHWRLLGHYRPVKAVSHWAPIT